MIKIFRKIRQNLLIENKTSKYFKYAIGEIVLVVIGILIALQINNWNEVRKDQKQEIKLLKQLQTDLTANEVEINGLIKRIKINKFAMDSLLINLKNQEYAAKFPIYVALIHRKSFFNNSNSGYKLIGNGMAKLISNDSLLNGILQLYEKDFVNILTRQDLMNNKIEYKIYPLTNELFKINTNISLQLNEIDVVASEIYIPLDFVSLTKNQNYINNLIQLNKTFEIRLSYLALTKEKLAMVLHLIDRELKK
ncbi:DUF6090 family protein [Polaribacter sp.]|uniref:DUF6090 family protein n=1 Tax=Polaribacter sp. TaxID=1920175 RepID=UPI00404855C3